MNDKQLCELVEQIERTLSQISTKGQDSFFMVASLNSLRHIREELSRRQNGEQND